MDSVFDANGVIGGIYYGIVTDQTLLIHREQGIIHQMHALFSPSLNDVDKKMKVFLANIISCGSIYD